MKAGTAIHAPDGASPDSAAGSPSPSLRPLPRGPLPLHPLLVIAGPTGSGKSALAVALAREFRGEILNCDSLQLYRDLDIGTAKPLPVEREDIPHHLFDVLTIRQGFSAGEFARMARSVAEEIGQRGKLPIVVGGTGFYLKAMLEGLPVLPEKNESLRVNLQAREKARPGALHRLLHRLDPPSALQIHGNDVQKLLRALEVRVLTGRSRGTARTPAAVEAFDTLKIGLDPNRDELRRKLEARTRAMFQAGAFHSGLIDEVKALLAAGATGREKPFESLGYKQAILHLRGTLTLEQAIESTVIETRQYAKRQRTWFRRDRSFHWLEDFGDSPAAMARAVDLVRDWLATR